MADSMSQTDPYGNGLSQAGNQPFAQWAQQFATPSSPSGYNYSSQNPTTFDPSTSQQAMQFISQGLNPATYAPYLGAAQAQYTKTYNNWLTNALAQMNGITNQMATYAVPNALRNSGSGGLSYIYPDQWRYQQLQNQQQFVNQANVGLLGQLGSMQQDYANKFASAYSNAAQLGVRPGSSYSGASGGGGGSSRGSGGGGGGQSSGGQKNTGQEGTNSTAAPPDPLAGQSGGTDPYAWGNVTWNPNTNRAEVSNGAGFTMYYDQNTGWTNTSPSLTMQAITPSAYPGVTSTVSNPYQQQTPSYTSGLINLQGDQGGGSYDSP
jgi:uncharacterized membrane protein YgcG